MLYIYIYIYIGITIWVSLSAQGVFHVWYEPSVDGRSKAATHHTLFTNTVCVCVVWMTWKFGESVFYSTVKLALHLHF